LFPFVQLVTSGQTRSMLKPNSSLFPAICNCP
jgi:hypothetical protein